MTYPSPRSPGVWGDLAVAVPVYARPRELVHLLHSVTAMNVLPGEIVLCEDDSPQRGEIGRIAAEWRDTFARLGTELRYIENPRNLGYDGNVRQLFRVATRRWVMLLGNDDAMLPDAAVHAASFLTRHPEVKMTSRSYVRFAAEYTQPAGITRLSNVDRLYTSTNADPGMLMRLCGFVGGLIVDRDWAQSVAAERYDGTLYYQLYLAALAFCGSGIGYIAAPIVGSRIGNPPLFGSASSEKRVHVPGTYTPRARAAMWEGVLRICADVEQQTSVPLVPAMRRELSGKQSFHVFEMIAVQGRGATRALVREFARLGLMGHPMPWAIALLSMLLGRRVAAIFRALRAGQRLLAARAPISTGTHLNETSAS